MAEHVLESAGHGLERVIEPASRWAFRLAMLVMALMMIPVFVDVILRYVSDGSLEGAYELEEFSLALVSFLALASIQAQKEHINITFVTDHLSAKVRLLLETFVWCASAPLVLMLAWRMAVAALGKYDVGEVSFDLELPIWPCMMVCAAGMALFGLYILAQALENLGKSFREGYGSGAVAALVSAVIVLSIPVWFDALGIEPSAGALGGFSMLFMMLLLFIGMPIGLSMALVGSLGLLLLQPNPEAALSMIGQSAYSKGAEYSYTVIPLFILMGEFAYYSGISRELFYAANMWLGRLPGGLAVAGIAGCTGFAAVCGDSMATAVTMGSVALPEMRKKNYHPGMSCACLAAGGTLGILIPPSMGFIFYAIVALVFDRSIFRIIDYPMFIFIVLIAFALTNFRTEVSPWAAYAISEVIGSTAASLLATPSGLMLKAVNAGSLGLMASFPAVIGLIEARKIGKAKEYCLWYIPVSLVISLVIMFLPI